MIRVHLEKFEGPLALLIHLIKKNEMDIYDIEITKITAQYLEYIQVMKQLDLEVAGDFVAMAATLIQIKSKMLLPQYNEQGEVIETEDPRKELVQRLFEYQRFQDAAKQLGNRPLLGRENWARPIKEVHGSASDGEIILDEGGLFALIAGYKKALKAMKKQVHVVFKKAQSVASRVMEIRHLLVPGRRLEMRELITEEEAKQRPKLVITFLSCLELAKLGFVSIFQSDIYAPIHLDVKRNVEGEIIQQMDDYEAKDLDQALMEAPAATLEDTLPLMEAAQNEAMLANTPEEEVMAATDEEIDELERMLGEDAGRHPDMILEAVEQPMVLSEETSTIEKAEPLGIAGAALDQEMKALESPVLIEGGDQSQENVMSAAERAKKAANGLFDNGFDDSGTGSDGEVNL